MENNYNLSENNDRFNNYGGLNEKQIKVAHLLHEGEHTKLEIADIVNVHRNTITAWCKDVRVKALVQELEDEKNRQALSQLKTMNNRAIEILKSLAECSDKRVQMEAVKYIIDRNLGKTTSKIEIEDKNETNDDIEIKDILERIDGNTTPIALKYGKSS